MCNKKIMLNIDDIFPTLEIDLVNDNKLTVPADLLGSWAVVLFYRGGWCGFCRQQLMNYQVHAKLFKQMDIHIIVASSDSQVKAIKTVEQLNLTYPMGYGLCCI